MSHVQGAIMTPIHNRHWGKLVRYPLDDDGNGVYATSSGVTVISNCTTANDIYELVPNQTVSAWLTHGDDEERLLVLYSATFESDLLLFDCFCACLLQAVTIVAAVCDAKSVDGVLMQKRLTP